MTDQPRDFPVGIDWGHETHAICVIDQKGAMIEQRAVRHSGESLAEFIAWLLGLAQGEPQRVAIAIERPNGPVVESLMAFQLPTFVINPKQRDRFRDRHSVAGAKDDRRDAFVPADSLRADRDVFRKVTAAEPAIVELRDCLRIDEEFRDEEVRLNNRLFDLLTRYFPQMNELTATGSDPFVGALLQRAATPQQARKFRCSTIAKLLKQHRIRRFDADHVAVVLRQLALPLDEATITAAARHVLLLLPRLKLVHQQRKQSTVHLDAVLGALLVPESDGSGAEPEGTFHR